MRAIAAAHERARRGRVHLPRCCKNLRGGGAAGVFPAGARATISAPPRSDFTLLLAIFNFALWVAGGRACAPASTASSMPPSLPVYLATVALVLGAAMLIALAFGSARAPAAARRGALRARPGLRAASVVALLRDRAHRHRRARRTSRFFGWIWIASLRAVAICAGTRRPQFYSGALVVTRDDRRSRYSLSAGGRVLEGARGAKARRSAARRRAPVPPAGRAHRARARRDPARAGRAARELYFVGFAPDASQDVFVHEMRFVKRLFDERFGTAGRSIALASSYDALEEFPIASVTNLGARPEPRRQGDEADEDVLFLFLSAHGDREHRLSARAAAARARAAHAHLARPHAAGLGHQVARDRRVGLLLGRLHRAAARRQHARHHRRGRPTAPRSAASRAATSPTSARPSSATRSRRPAPSPRRSRSRRSSSRAGAGGEARRLRCRRWSSATRYAKGWPPSS